MSNWRIDCTAEDFRELARPEPNVLRTPTQGWEAGLKALLLDGRCPWCRGTIADLALNTGEVGVTWDCAGMCNP